MSNLEYGFDCFCDADFWGNWSESLIPADPITMWFYDYVWCVPHHLGIYASVTSGLINNRSRMYCYNWLNMTYYPLLTVEWIQAKEIKGIEKNLSLRPCCNHIPSTKHIDVCYHHFYEHIRNKQIKIFQFTWKDRYQTSWPRYYQKTLLYVNENVVKIHLGTVMKINIMENFGGSMSLCNQYIPLFQNACLNWNFYGNPLIASPQKLISITSWWISTFIQQETPRQEQFIDSFYIELIILQTTTLLHLLQHDYLANFFKLGDIRPLSC